MPVDIPSAPTELLPEYRAQLEQLRKTKGIFGALQATKDTIPADQRELFFAEDVARLCSPDGKSEKQIAIDHKAAGNMLKNFLKQGLVSRSCVIALAEQFFPGEEVVPSETESMQPTADTAPLVTATRADLAADLDPDAAEEAELTAALTPEMREAWKSAQYRSLFDMRLASWQRASMGVSPSLIAGHDGVGAISTGRQLGVPERLIELFILRKVKELAWPAVIDESANLQNAIVAQRLIAQLIAPAPKLPLDVMEDFLSHRVLVSEPTKETQADVNRELSRVRGETSPIALAHGLPSFEPSSLVGSTCIDRLRGIQSMLAVDIEAAESHMRLRAALQMPEYSEVTLPSGMRGVAVRRPLEEIWAAYRAAYAAELAGYADYLRTLDDAAAADFVKEMLLDYMKNDESMAVGFFIESLQAQPLGEVTEKELAHSGYLAYEATMRSKQFIFARELAGIVWPAGSAEYQHAQYEIDFELALARGDVEVAMTIAEGIWGMENERYQRASSRAEEGIASRPIELPTDSTFDVFLSALREEGDGRYRAFLKRLPDWLADALEDSDPNWMQKPVLSSLEKECDLGRAAIEKIASVSFQDENDEASDAE